MILPFIIRIKIVTCCFLLSLSAQLAASQVEEISGLRVTPVPAEMSGVWQVTEVLVDRGDKEVVQGLDDKYLVPGYDGRIFTFTPDSITINVPSEERCEVAEFGAKKSTAASIVARSVSGRFSDSSKVTPRDMGLPLDNSTVVEVLYLICKGKLQSKDQGMKVFADLSNALWFIRLDKSRLVVSWHDQMLLVLSRVSNKAKPVASFNCAMSETAVEKTICSSIGVAAYDKSLSQSYRQLMDYYRSKSATKEEVADLKKAQREWLKERDACGADVLCLEKVMSLRIGELIYDLGDYIYQNR